MAISMCSHVESKLFVGVFWIPFAYLQKIKYNDSNSYHKGENTFNDLGLLTSQSWPEAIVIAIQKAV